ncbi:MAG: NCS2 family permease [Propionibacteriaceae bacterium]|jgi:AGZA family xanthine/uracil permease-like MFS transporter|nr:NCS2 family permease [Propionibacteriaceae bacterium]
MVQNSPRPKVAPAEQAQGQGGLDSFFEITKRGSSLAAEIRGGLVTFFSMAYIIALNPIIIGTTADKNGNLISGLPIAVEGNIDITMGQVAAATALIAGIMTILMGLVGRFPIALATGLGLNAVAAYSLAPNMTWPQVMGLIVWEGVIITILVLTGFRKAVFSAVPKGLRTAISVGIGLFIGLIGLVDAGFVRKPSGGGTTPVELGVAGQLLGWPIFCFIVGLILLIVLYVRRVKGSMLIAIIVTTVLSVVVEAIVKTGSAMVHPTGWSLNVPGLDKLASGWGLPDLGLLGRVDLFGAFSGGPKVWITVVLTILALMLADFFDSMGTIVAVGQQGGLLAENGNPPRTQQILLVDSVAAIAGGLGSVSSNTSYIESASGVGEGARTGFASVVTGLLFVVSMFIAPVVGVVPSEAVAPVLVVVGFLMLQQVRDIDWTKLEIALPAFFMVTLMAFTYSITVGIGAGFLVYLLIKSVLGKAKEVHPLLWVVGGLFLIYFAQGVLLNWIG